MDGTEERQTHVEPASPQIPEFPDAERRERGLWNNGGERMWLRLLDLLWRHSYVRKCLARDALLGHVRTAGFVRTTHSLEHGSAPGLPVVQEHPAHQRDNRMQTADADALYLRPLMRAIASAASLECAGRERNTQATVCALSGRPTAAEEHPEPRADSGAFNTTENFLLKSLRNTSWHIPPLLHFVWCGKEPLPDFFLQFKQSWKKNSLLIHALWRDAEIKGLVSLVKGNDYCTQRPDRCHAIVPVPSGDKKGWRQRFTHGDKEVFVSRILTELAHMVEEEERLGAKSDLVRLLLLHTYGGVYADVDMELVRKLPNCFLTDATFVAGAQREDAVELGNALLACTPRHELLTYIITQIVEHRSSMDEDDLMQVFRIVECYTGESSLRRQGKHTSPLVRTNREAMQVISSTGPGLLTKAVMEWLQTRAHSRGEPNYARLEGASAPDWLRGLESVCICPPCVFYPVPNHARNTLRKRGDEVC